MPPELATPPEGSNSIHPSDSPLHEISNAPGKLLMSPLSVGLANN